MASREFTRTGLCLAKSRYLLTAWIITSLDRGLVSLGARMIDPPRPGSDRSCACLWSAGIRVKMITGGDHGCLARAIARMMGLNQTDEVRPSLSRELGRMNNQELAQACRSGCGFAQVA